MTSTWRRGRPGWSPGHIVFLPVPRTNSTTPGRPIPDQLLVEAPRGSLVVFNGYIWHSGTDTTRTRSAAVSSPSSPARSVAPMGSTSAPHGIDLVTSQR